MHIAICNDNIADRKQLERLLKREGDMRALQTEGFYVDSYGHMEALLKSPLLYDAFFVDMSEHPQNNTSIVDALTKLGVNAPIFLCSSQNSYAEYVFPKSILFLDKPIKKDELATAIDYAISAKASAIPPIKIPTEFGEYCCVKESEILYAISQGPYVKITLTTKKTLSFLSTLDNLYSELTQYPMLFPINSKVLVNARHLKKLKLFTAYMTDGTHFRIALGARHYAKYALKEFHSEPPQSIC